MKDGHEGVCRVEHLSEHVDLITIRIRIPESEAVVYQQFTWDRKTYADVQVRKFVCF